MSLSRWMPRATTMQGAPVVAHLAIDPVEWRDLAQDIAAAGGRLLALWGTNRFEQCDTVQAVAIAPPRVLAITV